METVVPDVPQLPPAPQRQMSSSTYPVVADTWAAAINPWTLKVNLFGTWMGQQVDGVSLSKQAALQAAAAAANSATAANASKNAAAQSAIDATNNGAAQVGLAAAQAELATSNGAAQVALAAEQAGLATTNGAAQVALAAEQVELAEGIKDETALIRDQAQIIADAALAAVGIPSYLMKPGYVFEVNDDATGIRWGTRHKIGEAILTARDMDASYLPLAGGTYLQSAYPELFAEVGLIGSVAGDVWSQVMAVGAVPALSTVKRGKDGVLIGLLVSDATSTYYRSTDNGATWSALSYSAGAQSNSSTSSARSIGTDGKGVWVLSARSSGSGLQSLCRSTDNGLTWVNIRVNASTDIYASACDSDGNGTWIIAGGISSLNTLRSVDNGLTWVKVQESVGGASAYSVAGDKLGTWIINVGTSNYRSTDNGLTWTQISSGMNQIFGLASNGKSVWLAVGNVSTGSSVMRSADNGLTWSAMQLGLNTEITRSVATDFAGNWFVGTSSGRVGRSTDEGQSWTLLPIATTGFLSTDFLHSTVMINSDVLIIGVANSGAMPAKVRRSNGTYPYDSATMFKLPDLRAPQGMNYLIKAKEAA